MVTENSQELFKHASLLVSCVTLKILCPLDPALFLFLSSQKMFLQFHNSITGHWNSNFCSEYLQS